MCKSNATDKMVKDFMDEVNPKLINYVNSIQNSITLSAASQYTPAVDRELLMNSINTVSKGMDDDDRSDINYDIVYLLSNGCSLGWEYDIFHPLNCIGEFVDEHPELIKFFSKSELMIIKEVANHDFSDDISDVVNKYILILNDAYNIYNMS